MLNIYYKIEFGALPEKSIFNWEMTLGDLIAVTVSAIALITALYIARKQISQSNTIYSMQIFSQFQFEFQRQWHEFQYLSDSDEEKHSIVIDIFSNLEMLAKSYNHNQIVDPFRIDAKNYLSSVLILLFSNEYFKDIFEKSRSEIDTYKEVMSFHSSLSSKK